MNEAQRRVSAEFLARHVQSIRTEVQLEIDRLKAVTTKGDKGERGEPGQDGSVGIDGINGKDGVPGKDGEKGEKGDLGESGEPGKNGSDGINGKDGAPGIDGRSGDRGEKGDHGENGADGKSITLADVQQTLDAAIARMELDFERRGMEAIQRAIDRIEKPRDGRDGRDGIDGVKGHDGRDCIDLATLDIRIDDDFRTWHFGAMAGDKEVTVTKHVPMPMHKGVYRLGEQYQRGDIVSFSGSAFIAKRDTTSRPETDDSWQLFIKRGRDGKDGMRGERGEPGRDGKTLR